MFRRQSLRYERFTAEAHYHSAYNFLSLRGVLAERWAHGPYFGAFNDLGSQITLTPSPEDKARLQAYYGLKSSGLNWEALSDLDLATRVAHDWIADAYAALQPRRTVRLNTRWFVLYPIDNPDRVSRKLRDNYYSQNANLNALKPERFSSFHSAIDMLMIQGTDLASLVIGVVGPPHEGTFFSTADPERDSRWWLGARYDVAVIHKDGIEDAPARLHRLVTESRSELDRAVGSAFTRIIE